VPASIVNQIVNLHRAQLRGVIELGGVRKVRNLYENVRAELEADLASMVKKGQGQTFTAFHLRTILLQVRDGLRAFQHDFAPELANSADATATLAQRHVVGAIKAFEKRFAGTEPVLRLEEASVFRSVYRGVEPSLLMRYHRLVGNYPAQTIQRVQGQLAMSMIKGEGVDQAVRRIASKGGIFDRERYRAERIVRTEGSYAYGQVNQQSLHEVSHEVPRLQKRLVATFDQRTGKDSKILNGQTVPYDKPFVYMKPLKGGGTERVEFMQPPGRPNDREVVVPWRADYTAPAAHPGPVDPKMPSSLRVYF
jgi:uncharacterized protein with gpF-like domain